MGTPLRAAAEEPVYVISVAARLVGLPGWVLRVLDQEGVVVPSRTESNRRLYSDNDIALLNRVRHLTEELGVNIAGVKVILEMERARDANGDTTSTSVTVPQTALAPQPSPVSPAFSEAAADPKALPVAPFPSRGN